MAILNAPLYYRAGISGQSTVIGYESGTNRVVRFSFTTGSDGATGISINITSGTIKQWNSQDYGASLTSIPFYITTSDTSHANANASRGYEVTGYITRLSDGSYSGNASVTLLADTTYYIWFFPASTTYSWAYWNNNADYYTDCTTEGVSKFALTISAGDGSVIMVNRTSSPMGLSVGNLETGSEIYINDTLKITFNSDENYRLLSQTLNGVEIVSGNTHTVIGDMVVESIAQVLSSDVGATDANIGSKSTITITKYNQGYYHSLQCVFGEYTGYISSNGNIQSEEARFSNTSVSFSIPELFYKEIPDSPDGICTIICRTYGDEYADVQLGNDTTCQFVVTAPKSVCRPDVYGTVVDINETTKALTGDEKMLIRYKSIAKCTIDARPNYGASIEDKTINGATVSGDDRIIYDVSESSFVFSATDSRGYSNSETVTPEVISYIALTCHPNIYRPSPTSDKMMMTVSGNMYRGSFGAYSNTLKIQYRYRHSGNAYGQWEDIDPTLLTLGVSSYKSTNDIELKSYPEKYEDGSVVTDEDGNVVYQGFDYRLNYDFQIRATDGAGVYILSTVNRDVPVSRGIPVFDWGENDFNINVALTLNKVNILDIIYPIGTVYMHGEDVLPPIMSSVGAWDSVPTEIDGVYAWKRTA